MKKNSRFYSVRSGSNLLKFFIAGSVAIFSVSSGYAFAFDRDMGDLEVTMEVVDESSLSTADVVNKIALPVRILERARHSHQVRNINENDSAAEDDVEQARETVREMEMYQEQVQEQQLDSMKDVGTMTREMRGNREFVDDAVQQGVDAVIDDVRQQGRKNGR